MMPEKKYIADFTADCVERVADPAAFIPSTTLYECFNRYVASNYPSAAPIRPRLFLQLFASQDGMKSLMRGVLPPSSEDRIWGFKTLALSPAGKKLMEENK